VLYDFLIHSLLHTAHVRFDLLGAYVIRGKHMRDGKHAEEDSVGVVRGLVFVSSFAYLDSVSSLEQRPVVAGIIGNQWLACWQIDPGDSKRQQIPIRH